MNKPIRFTKRWVSKCSSTLMITAAGALLFAGIASAHVTVKPEVSQPEAWETYTLKVPVEKEIPTTKVALKVPAGLAFKQYESVPGWKVTTDKDSAGEITTVMWTAEGEGILPGQYQRFSFVAQNPAKNGDLPWNAYQYYSDGSIVEWTGDESSEHPHSITKITTESSAVPTPSNQGHDSAGTAGSKSSTGTDTSAAADDQATQPASPAASSGVPTVALILSIVACILGAAAVGLSMKRRK